MGDFLEHLVQRTLSPAESVRPMVRSRFVPLGVSQAQPDLVETETWVAAPETAPPPMPDVRESPPMPEAEPMARQQPHPPAARPTPRPQPAHLADAGMDQTQRPERSAPVRPRATSPAEPAPPPMPLQEQPGREEDTRPVVAVRSEAAPRRDDGGRVRQPQVGIERKGRARSSSRQIAPAEQAALPATPERSNLIQVTASRAIGEPPSPATATPIQPLAPAPPEPSGNQDAGTSPAAINVTIGRIEVKATVAGPKAERQPQAQPAIMTLETYLKRRNTREGRGVR